MIAALNFSHNFLEILLHYGGIDIHKINNNKLTTYQIAVNAQNERAVKLLMGYENKSKKSQIINKTRLSEPVDIVIEE